MKTKNKKKLHAVFASIDCDLEVGLAYCLAEMLGTSPAVIFAEYESWQIA